MRARLVLLAVVVVGAIGLWWLRPRTEGLLTVEKAQKKVHFRIRSPQRLPSDIVLVGVKVEVPKPSRIMSAAYYQDKKIRTIREGLNLGISWRFDERTRRVVANSIPPPTTPAAVMGVQPGDYLLEVKVNGQAVSFTSAAQFEEAMQRGAREVSEGKDVSLKVMTRHGPRTFWPMSDFSSLSKRSPALYKRVSRRLTSSQPLSSQPLVVFLYQRKGRNFNLFQQRAQPGVTTRWGGQWCKME